MSLLDNIKEKQFQLATKQKRKNKVGCKHDRGLLNYDCMQL